MWTNKLTHMLLFTLPNFNSDDSTGVVKNILWISAQGQDPSNECPDIDVKHIMLHTHMQMHTKS